MRLKNEIFAHVLDWLVQKNKVEDQKDLAIKTGISQNTISRIMTGKVEPSDDTLRKLNATFGNIFNMQYLRGADPIHMLIEDLDDGMVAHFLPPKGEERNEPIDHSSLVNAALAAKDETIAVLREQLSTKDELIVALRQQIELLKQQVTKAQAEDYLKDFSFATGVAETSDKQDHVRV